MVEVIGLLVRSDVHMLNQQLAPVKKAVRILKIRAPFAQGFDLCAN